jgi:hypothetical protein
MAYLYVTVALLAALLAASAGGWLYWRRARRRKAEGDYPVRRDWSRSASSVNISSFVYLDVDRDGRYGVGDRPMAGIVARLSGPGGRSRAVRTNINGFANFKASTTARRAPIRRPGTYGFAVSVPDGFVATSANAVQSREFRLLPGSPAGICSDGMVQPVGLAPLRYVTGSLAPGAAAAISALKGGEVLARETLEAGRSFRFLAPAGAELVAVSGAGVDRIFTLSPYPAALGVLAADRDLIEPDAVLETIGFDDLTPGGLRKIPSGYRGLNWFNLNVLSRDFETGGQGYVNGNTSGHHLCYTSSGHPAEIWSGRPFGFHSVMLCAAWLRSEGEVANVESWRGERLIARDRVVLSALAPLHYAPMLGEVTRIRISSDHCWQIAIDDLTLAR